VRQAQPLARASQRREVAGLQEPRREHLKDEMRGQQRQRAERQLVCQRAEGSLRRRRRRRDRVASSRLRHRSAVRQVTWGHQRRRGLRRNAALGRWAGRPDAGNVCGRIAVFPKESPRQPREPAACVQVLHSIKGGVSSRAQRRRWRRRRRGSAHMTGRRHASNAEEAEDELRATVSLLLHTQSAGNHRGSAAAEARATSSSVGSP
jgi:hypothetical protein